MKIDLPDINIIFEDILKVDSEFDSETKPIKEWLKEYRNEIARNRELLESDKNDITILLIILRDILVRAIKGEAAQRVFESLKKFIKTKADLNKKNFKKILKESKYRWGADDGAETICNVVSFFKGELNWNFKKYFREAEKKKDTNFLDDKLLGIKYIGLKLRDLALSNFSPNYPAIDTHLSRVLARTGLICYGYSLLSDDQLEIGNNPSNPKNYLFLHKLFLELSSKTQNSQHKYSPSEIDRILWHFGRSICQSKPNCKNCPIKKVCLKESMA